MTFSFLILGDKIDAIKATQTRGFKLTGIFDMRGSVYCLCDGSQAQFDAWMAETPTNSPGSMLLGQEGDVFDETRP